MLSETHNAFVLLDSDDPYGLSARNDDPSIQDRIDEYWDSRSRGYNHATALLLKDTAYYDVLFDSLIPPGRKGRVLDVATGCGHMAIIVARKGHDVTAIDTSEKMLYYAQRFSDKENLNIRCIRMDMNKVSFEDESFDIIIADSALWLSYDPVKALRSWISVLKPGGYLAIIDSNYHLACHDPDYGRFFEYRDMAGVEPKGIYGRTNIDDVDMDVIHRITCELPLCRYRRPAWDVSALLGLGMKIVRLDCTDDNPYRAMFSSGYLNLPMDFTLVAVKPLPSASVAIAESVTSDLIDRIRPDPVVLKCAKAMSNTNRMLVLNILAVSAMNVSELSDFSGLSAPLVSQALKTLKEAGLVESHRCGKETYYHLSDPEAFMTIIDTMKRFPSIPDEDD